MSELGYVAVMILRTRHSNAEIAARKARGLGDSNGHWVVKWAYAVESMWDAKPTPLTEVVSDCEVIVGANLLSEEYLQPMVTRILTELQAEVLDPKVYAGRNGFP